MGAKGKLIHRINQLNRDRFYLQLITIRKCIDESYLPPILRRVSEMEEDSEEVGGHVPAHKDFRVKYFQGFKKFA